MRHKICFANLSLMMSLTHSLPKRYLRILFGLLSALLCMLHIYIPGTESRAGHRTATMRCSCFLGHERERSSYGTSTLLSCYSVRSWLLLIWNATYDL